VKINWRKWNRVLHRDLGYFFFGMTVIYAVSGIALNHINDWNPSYSVHTKQVAWTLSESEMPVSKQTALAFLERYGEGESYKKHYHPEPGRLKIFLKNGTVDVDLTSGLGIIEKLKRRPLFYEVNFLHYNPRRLWTWFSDIFCIALILVAVTGLFIIRGKNGISGRGAWLTALGVAIPLILLYSYLN
jgi:hypothetical protein